MFLLLWKEKVLLFTVKRILPRENTERQMYVSEMLFHVARDLFLKKNMPRVMKNKIEKRRREIKNNKISFVQIEKRK
jgi:hypothetical protein